MCVRRREKTECVRERKRKRQFVERLHSMKQHRLTAFISVLQCVAVCCSVLQRVAACCSVLQCVAVCCSVL